MKNYQKKIILKFLVYTFLIMINIISIANAQTWEEYNRKMIKHFSNKNYQKALIWGMKAKNLALEEGGGLGLLLAKSYNNIAEVYKSMKSYDAAVKFYFDAIKIYETDEKIKYPGLALCYNNLAGAYLMNKQYSRAVVFFQKAIQTIEVAVGLDDSQIIPIINNILKIYEFKKHTDSVVYKDLKKKLKKIEENKNKSSSGKVNS